MAKTKNLVTAEYYHRWGEHYYGLAADMEDDKAPQTKIDASWSSASINFWQALALGNEKAPLWLFKCFKQGLGVKKDDDIATLMYGAALKFTPKDCAKIPDSSKPVIPKPMNSRIEALVKLVKQTHKEIADKEVELGFVLDQMTKFNNAIKLPSGKLIQSCFTEKSTAAITHDEYGASTSAHDASYETCPDTSFESESGDVAMGGVSPPHHYPHH